MYRFYRKDELIVMGCYAVFALVYRFSGIIPPEELHNPSLFITEEDTDYSTARYYKTVSSQNGWIFPSRCSRISCLNIMLSFLPPLLSYQGQQFFHGSSSSFHC